MTKPKWRALLAALVANHLSEDGQAEDPFFYFEFEPPSRVSSEPGLRDFFRLCGGGSFGVLRIYTAEEREQRSSEWSEAIPNEVLAEGRRRVIGEEADGVPILWDSESGWIRTYYWRDAWERPEDGWADLSFESPEALWSWLFDPEAHGEEWGAALRKIAQR